MLILLRDSLSFIGAFTSVVVLGGLSLISVVYIMPQSLMMAIRTPDAFHIGLSIVVAIITLSLSFISVLIIKIKIKELKGLIL